MRLLSRNFLILSLLFIILQLNGQSENKKLNLSGVVYDAETNAPLIYASVYRKSTGRGTASNTDGYFYLRNIPEGDTLIISFVGYENKKIVATGNVTEEYYLQPSPKLLDETMVFADYEFLYRTLVNLKRRKQTEINNVKTYFCLETKINNELNELVEAFYNGDYQGYDNKELHFKNAQIGVKPYNSTMGDNYFISSENSKIFSKYRLFDYNHFFPHNPFELHYRQLKKNYKLQLLSAFKERGAKIYIISFTPIVDKNEFFEGIVWVDATNNYIRKVNLNIKDAEIQPFLPFGNIRELHHVNLKLSKTFRLNNHNVELVSMNFDIDFKCTNYNGQLIHPTTHTYIKPFNYSQGFYMPFFEFADSYHKDYRNAGLTEDDSVFWNNREFYITSSTKANDEFISKHKISSKNDVISFSGSNEKSVLNNSTYVEWDRKRFVIEQASKYEIEKASKTTYYADRYNFNFKIYLNLSHIQDSIYHVTKSIFDPINSYYYFETNSLTKVFFNIYFDLLEIERLNLELAIADLKDKNYDAIKLLYEKSTENFKKTSEKYVSETNRGRNIEALQRWNKKVNEELRIDNIFYFGLDLSEDNLGRNGW